ncbi:MAG: class I SAM-dependent methyltransferase, partial [Pseudomonadota bacterium]
AFNRALAPLMARSHQREMRSMASKLRYKFQRFVNKKIAKTFLDAEYYQNLHDHSNGYQQNNWLLDQEFLLSNIAGKDVIEIGCGNGKFIKTISASAKSATGLDWAISPQLGTLPENVSVIQKDVVKEELPNGDIACSGDVLEHFTKEQLEILLPKLAKAAPKQYHVIACYDDTHSHLTVENADWWLNQFTQKMGEGFRLLDHGIRDPKKPIAIVSNL